MIERGVGSIEARTKCMWKSRRALRVAVSRLCESNFEFKAGDLCHRGLARRTNSRNAGAIS